MRKIVWHIAAEQHVQCVRTEVLDISMIFRIGCNPPTWYDGRNIAYNGSGAHTDYGLAIADRAPSCQSSR